MKYLLLNQDITDLADYGHYVSFNEETQELGYEFGYAKIGLAPLFLALQGIREIAGTDKNVALYGKSGVPAYNTSAVWTVLCGTLDSSIKNSLDEEYSWFPGVSLIELPNGDLLDAPHFWATMSMYFSNHGDLGGWAGDLLQYSYDLHNNPDIDFPSGSFGKEDWCSDIDAHNIFYRISSETTMIQALQGYWPEVTETSRCLGWLTRGTGVKSRYTNSPDATLLRTLRQSTYSVVTDQDLENAFSKMQEYLNNHR